MPDFEVKIHRQAHHKSELEDKQLHERTQLVLTLSDIDEEDNFMAFDPLVQATNDTTTSGKDFDFQDINNTTFSDDTDIESPIAVSKILSYTFSD